MLDLILPLECGGCGKPSTRWCEACAVELSVAADRPHVVNPRIDPQVPVFALGRYAGARRQAILAIKEHGRGDLVGPLARALAVGVHRLLTWGMLETRPVWVVVDGNNVLRDSGTGVQATRPYSSGFRRGGQPFSRVDHRFAAVQGCNAGRDGDRGPVILASVEQTQAGQYALTYPRRLGFGLGKSLVSLFWRTGDDIVVTRTEPSHPASYMNLNGVNSDAPATGVRIPVSTVAANPSTVYVAAPQGVLQYSASGAEGQGWSEVSELTVAGAVPVMPG